MPACRRAGAGRLPPRIRRLHAAGGSLREIAEALGLSHQRVHQMIDAAAEPTRRRWRRRTQLLPGPPGPCSFCGRSREECEQLIAGPGLFICERCVAQATRLSVGPVVDDRRVEGPMRLEAWGSEAQCSFCGKDARQGVLLVASELSVPGGKFGQDARICDECLDLCLSILAETSSPWRATPGGRGLQAPERCASRRSRRRGRASGPQ